jgi:hypothetical protein
MKALVAGWFSFEKSDFTAGDLLACDLVCEWLRTAGYSCDVAHVAPLTGGVDLALVAPADYDVAVFVCGPFMRNAFEAWLLERFRSCPIVGVNLTLPVPLDEWNPFDCPLERDSSERAHPDITFLTRQPKVPVVGICLVEPYDGALVETADAAVERLVRSKEMAVVRIDTRLDINTTGLRRSAEIESLLARMDAVITTRLHGTVLALKNGVPALAIDPERGGAKIRRQAETIGWPVFFNVDALDDEALARALEYCLSDEARTRARQCSERAAVIVDQMGRAFVSALTDRQNSGQSGLARHDFLKIGPGFRPRRS